MKIINSTICIIGAGPAGATTSIFLAKMGIEHVIVDAAEFPRDKICGDGLDTKTLRILNHIDPNIIPNELFNHPDFIPSWGISTIASNGKRIDFTHHPTKGKEKQCPFFICKRIHFDNFLVNKLNPEFATFLPGTKVTSIVKEGNTWEIGAISKSETISIKCAMLVGADGDHSTLLRHLGERKIDRQHYAGAVRQYWKGVEGLNDKNLIEIYYPKKLPMSYFWIFPLPNGEANVGYGMVSAFASKLKINIREEMKKIIANDPVMVQRFKNATPQNEIEGWGLPLASANRNLFGNGYLLVGDAASLISPTNGEGIGNAMHTGYVAAVFIQRAIKNNNFSKSTFTNYNREIFKSYRKEIKLFNLASKYAPNFNSFIYRYILVDNWLLKRIYRKKMNGWLHSAYEKKIIITP